MSFSDLITREQYRSDKLTESQSIGIQQYFQDVYRRQQNGEKFPFNLEELVPTVYSRKDNAIVALTSEYAQGVDYCGILTTQEHGSFFGGVREVTTYHLTAATFEHIVARRNRDIFDVYRQVFHHTVTAAIAALPAPTPTAVPLHLGIPDIQVAEFLNSMSTMLALTPNKKQAVFAGYLNLFDATRGVLLPDLAPEVTSSAEAAPHATATVLLAEHGVTVSTVQFNHQATVLGLLEPRQSAYSVGSKNGKPLPYHHVTVKGLAFGVNHPMSRDATRPIWYRETFSEMLELLRESEAQAA
jgi:AcrR family transcriptional regulator